MNWVLILLPLVLDFIKKMQSGGSKLPSKAKVRKAILLALATGDLKLPKGIPPELFKLVLPTILDLLWAVVNNTREVQRLYLKGK